MFVLRSMNVLTRPDSSDDRASPRAETSGAAPGSRPERKDTHTNTLGGR